MSGWTQEPTHWSLLLRSGDAGWTYFYERYRGPVAASFRRGGVPADAVEDLVQDFFVRALRRDFLGQADPARGCFRAYLATAARRHLIDHLRAQQRRKRDPGGGVLGSAGLEGVAVEGPSLDEAFDRVWAEEVMARAKAGVAADYAARGKSAHERVFTRRLEGSSWAEVAVACGVSEATAKGWGARYGDKLALAVRREVADTVSSAAELDAELAYLSRVLRAGR